MSTHTSIELGKSVPVVLLAEGRVECRTCRAHVRVIARGGHTAAAWCSVCCSTSIYDIEPARPDAQSACP
jgi:hypothetical protein